MNWKVNKKFIFWLIGAILIGVASNAIWEFLFKPFLLFTQNSVLTLTTLGIQGFQNAAYAEIAKNNHERVTLYFLAWFVSIAGGLVGGIIAFFFLQIRDVKKRNHDLSSMLRNIENNEMEDDIKSLDSVKSILARSDRKHKRLARLVTLIAVLSLGLFITLYTMGAREQYIVSASIHFEQLLAISAPYLPDHREKQLVSGFAQIKDRNDYERIILELCSIAEKNGLSVPKFKIW